MLTSDKSHMFIQEVKMASEAGDAAKPASLDRVESKEGQRWNHNTAVVAGHAQKRTQ